MGNCHISNKRGTPAVGGHVRDRDERRLAPARYERLQARYANLAVGLLRDDLHHRACAPAHLEGRRRQLSICTMPLAGRAAQA